MSRYRLYPSPAQEAVLRDFAQAMAYFFAGTHRLPSWRKAGRDEGFRIVALRPRQVQKLSRRMGHVWIPKAGWVRFRWSRAVPASKSYRVTQDRSGRWHIAFAATPEPKDWAEKVSTDLARRFDVIRVEDLKISNMTRSAKGTIEAPGRNVRQKPGLNREIMRSGWGLLVRRLEACDTCGFAGNADVNAAMNIAAGYAVTARGRPGSPGRTNREPQLALPSA